MNFFKVTLYVLSGIVLVVITGYLLSRVNLDGLNTERSILLQVIDKDRVLERKLRDQNANLNIKLVSLTEKKRDPKELRPESGPVKKAGNRGFLFRKSAFVETKGME
jgi:hypothetical protein